MQSQAELVLVIFELVDRRVSHGAATAVRLNDDARGRRHRVAARKNQRRNDLVVGRLGPDTAYDLALTVNRPEADAIALSCTNWQTMDAIERIERDTGKPVVSTTQATIWAALRAIGCNEAIGGYGKLLRS